MKVTDLDKINEAPNEGVMLAYLRDKVVFDGYDTIDNVKNLLKDKDLLEIHLFNNDKEFRAIMSTSKRFNNGCIQTSIDFKEDDNCYVSKADIDVDFSEPFKGKKILVLNHISYDENGLISIDNYRLKMED